MKPIDRGEVLGLADYEAIRERFRARVIAEKKLRRVALGPRASALFENRDTVLLQIQEMLRTERITRPGAIAHEIETYNSQVPGSGELSCTVMIEIAEKVERDAFLQAAAGFEKHVAIVAGGERVAAQSTERDGGMTDRTTAVHYFKFALPRSVSEALRALASSQGKAADVSLELVVDHPAYAVRAVLPAATLHALGEDLQD